MRILKYKTIEYSEVLLSELDKDTRMDAEFFQGEYIKYDNLIKSKSNLCINKFAFVTDGIHSSIDFDEESNINLISAKAPKEFSFDLSGTSYISNEQHEQNLRTSLQTNDVIISTVGTIGNCAIVTSEILPANSDRHVGIIRLINEDEINSHFLTAYLNTKYGKAATMRETSGNVQLNLYIRNINRLIVPKPSLQFQEKVKNLVLASHKYKLQSEQLYTKSEQLLFSELGLGNWKPQTISFKHYGVDFEVDNSITNKMFNEVKKNYRFDAEYWEPQYDEIISAFNKFPSYKLSNLVCYPVSSGATPKAGGDDYTDSKDGYPFLRAVDLVDGRVITSELLHIKPNIHEGMLKRTQIFKNDVLLSIAGTVGRSAIFDHDFEANINQALCILRLQNEKIVKRLYLVVFFNSFIGNKYLSKTARQGLQTNLNLKEVGSLEIPVIEKRIQEKIANTVLKSFHCSDRSKFNLELSKRAVEIFIEHDEEEALKYIQNES